MTIIKNNWLTTNILDRLSDKKVAFRATFNPYKFVSQSFDTECDLTAKEINDKFKNLYVGLSGGTDSQYVCKVFLRNNVDFRTIVVLHSGNIEEGKSAIKFCNDYGITPTVIELSDLQVVTLLLSEVFTKYNGYGIYSIGSIVSQNYCQTHEGTLITGVNLIGEDELTIGFKYYLYECDFYTNSIPFFLYRIETSYEMVKASEMYSNWIEVKQMLYKTNIASKIYSKYPEHVNEILHEIQKIKLYPLSKEKRIHTLGSLDLMMKLLKFADNK